MKKSFKVLLLAVMALCLAASAGFAADREGITAIKAAAKAAADGIADTSHAGYDIAISSMVMTLSMAGDWLSNDIAPSADICVDLFKAAGVISGDTTTASKDYDDLLKGATALSNDTDGTLRKASAANLAKVSLTAADLTWYGNYFKLYTTGNNSKEGSKEGDEANLVGNFYIAAGENLEAFKSMLSGLSAYLVKHPAATPKQMFEYVAATTWSDVFDSADVVIYTDGKEFTSFDIVSTDTTRAKTVNISLDVEVSLDINGGEILLVSVDGKELTSDDGVYTLSADLFAESGDKAVVMVYFASGDDSSFDYTITLIALSDDEEESATTETYLLKVSDITITPANAVSNTAKLISADTDNYSATLNLTNLDSTASGDWGSFAEFTASSDYLGGSFSVTVSTDAKLVNVYVMNGTAWDAVDTDELSGKVITPNTIGWYKVVLSADLIASSDKTVSGDAYFAFDFKVTSVDAPKSNEDVVTDAANASADATGGVGGNPIIASGQKIDTKFLSGTAISPSAFASFFSSATTVTMLSETELVAALQTLGLTESDMGDSENGYKALAFGLPSGFTLTANEKFFVLLTTNENGTGTNRLGVGVVSPKLAGSTTMVIVFKLLKNPAHTADFMTFDPGEYFVGATNDTASADTSSSTRAVFVTAGGTFNIKSEEATLLQGQTASGTATPVEDSGDDDDQETSSHGSSSGCDAGFGALALLAVAGALAARKVRK